ncbi:hypothetical protein FB567DRAFT_495404 [Paraphoma chrysanthemicola]|uniref:Uncharacterized protein n=1 Tax=Paraphoma chrysanthemicola TaxID=798071 RepID=A0A8K0VY65_9PLEO|nr:hypothetical protein FB567DRAFT_495404 [Paraphoma chrysanthemicola]
MSHAPRSQAPPSGCYYSAYSGAIATDAKSNFANFILSPDECHRRNGYWVFSNFEDQRRAYARGLRNPEAILCAVDLGDNPQPDISLSWRRGTVDRNITGLLTGNAAQHLMEIYDMRRHLGKTLSFGGQIPRYPVDVRLKAWWECRRAASRPSTSQTPIDSAASLASPSAFAVAALGSPKLQADFRRTNSSSNQSAQSSPPPFFATDSPIQQSPGRQPTHNGRYPRPMGINTHTQPPAKISGMSSESRNRSPHAFPVPGFAQQAPSDLASRTTHANEYAKVARCDDIPRQMGPPRQIIADPLPHLLMSGPKPVVRPFSRTSQHLNGPETSRSSENSDISTSQNKEGERLKLHASRPSVSSLLNGQIVPSRLDPESKKAQVLDKQVTAPQIPSKSPRKRFRALDEDTTMPHKKPKVNDHPMSQVDIWDQNIPSHMADGDVEKNTDMYLDLPCMDCGENIGHKSDCYIGQLKPATNLSVLDYRKFSELAERFDPGPWTTHEVPAVASNEDPEVAILGMAEVIRNESSYKSDEDLHSLPDAAMVMLWAFKTSPNMEIVG